MKKFKIFPLIILISLVLGCAAPAGWALDDPVLAAEAVILADLDTGEILYSKNMDQSRSPASLTKIMTAMLAFEAVENGQCTMDDIVTAGADCRTGMGEDSSTAGIQPGEQMSFRDLIYCALIQSANESCNIIATYLSGSIGAFVEQMNAKAAEIGCTNTHFVDPNGLSSENRTTAYDLYLISREAVRHQEFMAICNTPYYEIAPTNMADTRTMNNSNALISAGSVYGSGYLYEGASGVKTGYTRAAGYCLISTAERNDIRALAVVLGCGGQLNTGDEDFFNFVSTIDLYDWLFENFSHRTLLSSTEFFQKVDIALAQGDGGAILHPERDVTALLPNDIPAESISTSVTIYDDKLVAPIAAGTPLGEVRILVEGVDHGIIPLINSSDIEMSKFEYIKMQLKNFFSKGWVITVIVIILVLLAIYLILVARYRRLRRRHLRERRRAEEQRRRQRAMQAQQRARESQQQRVQYVDVERRRTNPADIDELFSRYDEYDESDGYDPQEDFDDYSGYINYTDYR